MPQSSYVDLCPLILSYMGTRFPTETQFLAAILKYKAVKTKLVYYKIEKDVWGEYY